MLGGLLIPRRLAAFLITVIAISQRPLVLSGCLIIAASVVHIAITNLAACIALLVPITMTIGHSVREILQPLLQPLPS
jgi:hypothetical protein